MIRLVDTIEFAVPAEGRSWRNLRRPRVIASTREPRRTRLHAMTQNAPIRVRRRILAILLVAMLFTAVNGCGAPARVVGPDAIGFESGELRSIENTALSVVDEACGQAVVRLGYDDVEETRDPGSVRYRAHTAGGEPVDIKAVAQGKKRTELRIRIGLYGDEAASRLVLEEIQQAL